MAGECMTLVTILIVKLYYTQITTVFFGSEGGVFSKMLVPISCDKFAFLHRTLNILILFFGTIQYRHEWPKDL